MACAASFSERAARQEIEHSDARHTSVFRRLFGDDWRDAGNYDLVLNTGRLAPAESAELIVDAIACPALRETPESRQALADRLAEARSAAFLAGEPRLNGAARGVYVAVSGGTVRLFDGVHGEETGREIARAVGASQNVAQNRKDLQASGSYAPYWGAHASASRPGLTPNCLLPAPPPLSGRAGEGGGTARAFRSVQAGLTRRYSRTTSTDWRAWRTTRAALGPSR